MKVIDIIKNYRPGSRDWNWVDEFDEIEERLFSQPILLGTDGRVLDGHHRIRLAVAVKYDGDLPIEIIDMEL